LGSRFANLTGKVQHERKQCAIVDKHIKKYFSITIGPLQRLKVEEMVRYVFIKVVQLGWGE